jgi:hypothetical protein
MSGLRGHKCHNRSQKLGFGSGSCSSGSTPRLSTGAVTFFRFDPTQAAANRKKSSGHALVGAVAYVSLTIRRAKPTPGSKAARYQLAANKQRKRRSSWLTSGALDDSPSCGADNVVRKFVPTIIN